MEQELVMTLKEQLRSAALMRKVLFSKDTETKNTTEHSLQV